MGRCQPLQGIGRQRGQQIQQQEMAGKIELEDRNKSLTQLRAENARIESDSRAYAMAAALDVVGKVDPRVLQALNVGQADPGVLIAQAFQGLAENAQRIGKLNISPDLLRQLAGKE